MPSQPFVVAVAWGTALAVAASTVLAWRQRPNRGATTFALTMLAATWWVATASLGLFTTENPSMRLFWAKLEWGSIAYLPVTWLLFALAYTGRSEYLRLRNVALVAALPTVSVVLAVTNGAGHTLVYRSQEFVAYGSVSLIHRTFGPWFWVHVVYSYLLLGAGTVLILGLVTERRLLYRGQVAALVLVVAAPWVSHVAYVTGYSVQSFDPTPYSMVVSGAAGLAALTGFRFLDAVPVSNRVAHNSVIANLDAGVVVADSDDRIVEVNPRARTLLCDERPVVGDPLAAVGAIDPAALPADGEAEITPVERDSGVSYYEIQATELRDEYDNLTGRILLVQDVTARRTRLQRLSVLNRVLRHNLRNEMTVVYGFADQLARDASDPERIAEDIRTKANELVELGEKAREIDELMAGGADRSPVNLARVLELERDRIGETHPHVETILECETGDATAPGAVGIVVRHLAENAVEHNGRSDPRIELAASATDDTVRVSVADNGPGIPADERAALEGDRETPLDHASGLGLWLTRWATDAVGGTIELSDRDESGAHITVELPRLDVRDDPETVTQ